jgi:putative membrane protein
MVGLNSKKFFNDSEKNKIENAIKEAEKKTSGEIVAMVVEQSGSYRAIENNISILFSLLFSLTTLYFMPEILLNVLKFKASFINGFIKTPFDFHEELRFLLTIGAWFVIPLQIIYFFISKLIFFLLPGIKRFFVSENHKLDKVHNRAMKAFHDHGLHKTRDETGVLFLLSLLERRVYILADKGIYEKISQPTLDVFAKNISRGIKEKKGAEALIEAIKSSGEILAKHFPVKSDDTNELSDEIITE